MCKDNHIPSSNQLLSSLSPDFETYDVKKDTSLKVADILRTDIATRKRGTRVDQCASLLGFHKLVEKGVNGDEAVRRVLKVANFCRNRHCPFCEWRRTMKWKSKFYASLPALTENYPSHKWLFLTLTIKNCEVDDLKSTLANMNAAWARMRKRKRFTKVIKGFIKTTEITRSKDGKAHPHFHILLLATSTYFKKKGFRITQPEWAELWGDCLKVDYTPVTDIRSVRAKPNNPNPVGSHDEIKAACEQEEKEETVDVKARKQDFSPLQRAIAETMKYSIKASDMIKDPSWFLRMVKQVNGVRMIALGGVLKDTFKETEQAMEKQAKELSESEEISDEDEVEFYNFNEKYRYSHSKKMGQVNDELELRKARIQEFHNNRKLEKQLRKQLQSRASEELNIPEMETYDLGDYGTASLEEMEARWGDG